MKRFWFLLVLFGFTGCNSYDLKIVKSYNMKRGGFEPSGVTFFKNSFYIAGDEGKIAVLKDDKIFYKKLKRGLDLEGITNDGKSIYAINEIKGVIYKIENFKIKERYKIPKKSENRRILKKNNKDGFEGIAFINEDEFGKHFVVSVQSFKKKSKLVFISLKERELKVDRIEKVKIKDISGLFYNKGILYILSDTENRIYLYNLKNSKIIKKYKIPGKNQEGIFVKGDKFFIADDSGKFFEMKLK